MGPFYVPLSLERSPVTQTFSSSKTDRVGEIGASHLATGGQSRKHQGRQAVYRSLAATQSYDCSSLTEFEWETRRTQGARPFNRVDVKLQCCAYERGLEPQSKHCLMV
ncbi:hypothetical protein TNIN_92491 [Trichonephila inaurata madagascariensis]|uniref:Uncharacterized protein n=1 Tax=Trichonephila inaurata madagascariensis TaxID=2747483 RepID=A0A8X6WZI2_9ARAC|nr:hypothetical protein TNIN_217121 [Trichonephila inaurata madagascariensis]GFY71728.1 hypothetical protein TNIN_92491 [Trichonephila inaurata madagascariensis]